MKRHFGNKFKVIGMMSGTSLDGLDLAAVEFHLNNGKWDFSLFTGETVTYSEKWLNKLKNAPTLSGEQLIELHSEYGKFIGSKVNRFIKKTGFNPDFIASHGHTIFHQPEKHFTFQAGNGAEIAASTKITTVADFRTGDVALGGQGAPLVPIGDQHLFSEFKYCLNLGGFGNISFESEQKQIAFDTGPANIILNYFAEKQGFAFDKNGELGKRGKVNSELLNSLNNISFYKKNPPKSLGREWVENTFIPILNLAKISDDDKLRTIYEHIAFQISKVVSGNGKMLITGGGAFNSFLLERIKFHTSCEIAIPSKEIIDFKEAIIFAFLGILRILDKTNCLESVTGASKDSSSGIVFLP